MQEASSDEPRRLPRELRSLVHHVELNRSGWWDSAMARLVVVSVWRASGASVDEIAELLIPSLDGRLPRERIEAAVERAVASGELVPSSTGATFKVAEAVAKGLSAEWSEVVRSEAAVQDRLVSLAVEAGVDADPVDLWTDFEELFMLPLVREGGARIYEVLTTPTEITTAVPTYARILRPICEEYGDVIRPVLVDFLEPTDDDVRAYVLRVLSSDFVSEAAGLDQAVLDKMTGGRAHPDRVRIFVDTNFLFSFLQLHDNPSNDIASDLIALVERAKSTIKIEIFVLPITVDETRGVLRDSMARLSGVNLTSSMGRASRRLSSSGLVGRYLDAAAHHEQGHLSATDFFGPYEANLVPILRDRGVELFNDALDDLRMDQDVVDDIHEQADVQNKTRERGAKPYERNLHDMVLWHFVKRSRPSYVDSPLEVGSWVCTVDFGLMGFDRRKRRGTTHPQCVSPQHR